jgi:hypothetical protein
MGPEKTLLELIAAYGEVKYNHGASLHDGTGTVRAVSDYMIEAGTLLAEIERRVQHARYVSESGAGFGQTEITGVAALDILDRQS